MVREMGEVGEVVRWREGEGEGRRVGGNLGGRTRPALSPCTIVMTPTLRVVMPHEFW